jgi:integrase
MTALTKRSVDAAAPRETEYLLWCDRLPRFGLRVYPTGRKVYVAQVRVGKALRRVKIGPHGVYTVEQARKRAEDIIRAAAEGRDPQREKQEARKALTVAELCDLYLDAARAGLVMTRFGRPKRASTLAIDEGRIARHIKPLIGAIVAKRLRRADVQRMADDIAAGKTAGTVKTKPRGVAVVTGGTGTAGRVVELLGGVCSWAAKRDLAPDINPAHGVERARGAPKDRVLAAAEMRRLGNAIRGYEATEPMTAAVVRLIALTGLRRGEACGLRWSEIDELGQCLRLAETKTGRSTRPLGKAALDLLRGLPHEDDAEFVFPRADGAASAEMKRPMAAIFRAAGLGDAHPHDLRRTYASTAANLDYGDATIAELLGHARRGVTERHYVRRSDPVLIGAADAVAAKIAGMLDGCPLAEVVPLQRRKR